MLQFDLALEHGPIEKQREFLWRLADAFDKDGQLADAEDQLRELLDMPLSQEQRLEALCFLAEIQVPLLGFGIWGSLPAHAYGVWLLDMPLGQAQRLEALCSLAEFQVLLLGLCVHRWVRLYRVASWAVQSA